MKKVISLILVFVVCLSLCACGSSASPTEKVDNGSTETVAEEPSGKSSLPKNIQIQVYNSMGYQEEDNAVETVAEETEPATDFVSVEYPKNPETNIAEGEGVVIQDVKLGFADQLPKDLLKFTPWDATLTPWDAERMTLNESMVYAVIQFKIKNLTSEEIDIADLYGDFLVELNYNNKFRYNTNSDAGACYISQGDYKLVWKTCSVGYAIEVAPLAVRDVELYIPCAREVSTDTENPLRIIFNSKFGGHDSFEFVVR